MDITRQRGEADCIGKDELIRLLIDTVAHNGNLLLNIGPKADGTIPSVQEERLLYLGAWLEQKWGGYLRNQTVSYAGAEGKEWRSAVLYAEGGCSISLCGSTSGWGKRDL